MANSAAYRHYQRIISRWPSDPLRPHISFPAALRRRIDQRILTPAQNPAENVTANEAQATVPRPVDEREELARVNALYSLLENRYAKAYPASERMMRPASNPAHYTKLIHELDEAPTRTRFQTWIKSWKGSLRFS